MYFYISVLFIYYFSYIFLILLYNFFYIFPSIIYIMFLYVFYITFIILSFSPASAPLKKKKIDISLYLFKKGFTIF
nr:hypothetical protein XLIUZIGB_XLIUZIGB_CDS_0077 [Caudoviricetes sp.]